MNRRLLHDEAYAAALRLLHTVAPCLREEERRDALEEFYAIVRDALEAFAAKGERLHQRLHVHKLGLPGSTAAAETPTDASPQGQEPPCNSSPPT
jgi:hypothetical protein